MSKIIKLKNIEEIAKTFQTWDDTYDYLIKTNDIDVCCFCLDNDNVWKRKHLKWMLEYFLDKEEYEKCNVLKKLMDKNYVANKKKQIELHTKMDKFNSLY